jgi:hypothetical protein
MAGLGVRRMLFFNDDIATLPTLAQRAGDAGGAI